MTFLLPQLVKERFKFTLAAMKVLSVRPTSFFSVLVFIQKERERVIIQFPHLHEMETWWFWTLITLTVHQSCSLTNSSLFDPASCAVPWKYCWASYGITVSDFQNRRQTFLSLSSHFYQTCQIRVESKMRTSSTESCVNGTSAIKSVPLKARKYYRTQSVSTSSQLNFPMQSRTRQISGHLYWLNHIVL